MRRVLVIAAMMLAGPAAAQATPPGEEPVAAYVQSNANAGATPFEGREMFDAFHGEAGISRIVETLVGRNVSDPRIADIFRAADQVRLRRTLKEQFCYILGGPCDYTGMDMKVTHKHMGLQAADMNALVENLQFAMDKEGIPFRVQNRFLAKLAPMHRQMIER